MGIEALAALAIAYLWRKLARIGTRADGIVDGSIDAGLDRLERMVRARLGDEPVLTRLELDAAAGRSGEDSRQRAADALVREARQDPAFADDLTREVQLLQRIDIASGGDTIFVQGDNNLVNSPQDNRKYFGLGLFLNFVQSHPVITTIIALTLVVAAASGVTWFAAGGASGGAKPETSGQAGQDIPDLARMQGEWKLNKQEDQPNGASTLI